MPSKLFISYRREDTGANAIGIGQYLEHEFGRKNVFIDVDMRAGVNFPTVLEQRLAECKVMLVLIGPHWLAALDEQGHRRLDDPSDWVRLEIAHALKRNITVIPVRVGGAELPPRAMLPDDIRGLLDHQAASVSTPGFRHEMAGLARDIQSIERPPPWRRFAAITAGFLFLLVILAFASWFYNAIERMHSAASAQLSEVVKQEDIWKSNPGEWIMYAFDRQPVAYYFRPSSVKTFGDEVAYTARFPLKSEAIATSENTLPLGTYEDDTIVLDCKKAIFAQPERTIYDRSGGIISHFRRGDPESLNLSFGEPIGTGTILSIAKQIMCDEQLRRPLLLAQQMANLNLSYLANIANGDGDILYGPTKPISDPEFETETLVVLKFREDRSFAELFPGQDVIGLPRSYRYLAETPQFDCRERKAEIPRTEYFDSLYNLEYLSVLPSIQPLEVHEGSPFGMLLDLTCGPSALNVAGIYQGINKVTYKAGGEGEQRISITIQQTGSNLKVSFRAAPGAQGEGTGTLNGAHVESIAFQSTAPGCNGSYEGSLDFAGDSVSWSYKGKDCVGPTEGHGTAKRVSG